MTTYSAPCPRCGTTIFTTIGGQAWLTCPSCAWYGLLNVMSVAVRNAGASAGSGAGGSGARQACPTCQNAFTYAPAIVMVGQPPRWYCTACGFQGPFVSGTSAPPAQPSPATQPATQPSAPPSSAAMQRLALLEALRADARLYGAEIADAVGRLTTHEATGLTLEQVWDRMQQAQDTLYTALGGRRMGDYPPDIEQVSRALVEVGVWHIVALGVVDRLNRPSTHDGEVAP